MDYHDFGSMRSRSHEAREYDPDFLDFAESVSVTSEELMAVVSMPELSSVREAKEYVRQTGRSQRQPFAVAAKVHEFQRRFAGGCHHLASALVALMPPGCGPRTSRKS